MENVRLSSNSNHEYKRTYTVVGGVSGESGSFQGEGASMRKLGAAIAVVGLVIMLAVIGVAPVGADSTVTVDHAHMTGWVFNNDGTAGVSSGMFVNGPATPPGGAGSVQLTVDSTAGEVFMTPQFAGTPLANISSLGYSTYGPNATLDASLQFDLDYDLTAPTHPYQGRMVYEPYQQGGAGTVIANTWQTWNPLDPNAKWWTTRAPDGTRTNIPCPQSSPCTLSTFKAQFPHAGIMTSLFPGSMGFKAGSGWSGGATVNTAQFVIGIGGTNTTFNFAPGTAAATFFVRTDGNDAFCNGEVDATFSMGAAPNCAFKTIQNAINNAVNGDTIIVHGGTYTEQVNITKSLTLTGDGAASTTINAPGTLVSNVPAPSGLTGYAVVGLTNNATLTMSGFTVAGTLSASSGCGDDLSGIAVYGGSTLALSASTVADIRNGNTALYGCQQGLGILIGRNAISQVGHATLTGVTVNGYQKGGIVIDGAGSDATVSGSTVTGPGTGSTLARAIAANGIQISRGATATVTNNQITNNACDNPCGPNPVTDTQSGGILIYNAAGGLTIQGNTLSGNDMAIYNYTPANSGATISSARSSARRSSSAYDGNAASSGQRNVVVNNTPTAITGNTLTGNRYEDIFLDEGTAALSGNSITGGNIGVEVASFGGETGNAQGTLTNNLITGATVAGIQLQLDPTATFQTKINGDSNSINGNALGVNNTTTTPITLTKNWWGTPNGPANSANTFNVGAQGNSVSANVVFVPWWSTITGTPGTLNGTVFAPVTTTNPANGQFSSIQAAVTAAPSGTVSAAAGIFTEAVTVGKTLTLNGAKHGVDARTGRGVAGTETILTGGGFSLSADGITLDGFTVQNPGSSAKVGVTLSSANSGYQVLNNIIQNNSIGIYGNSKGTTQTLIKQNLIRHNNEVGAASGNGIYTDGGTANLVIDSNTFVDNVNGGAAGFFGAPGTQHDITFSNNNLDSDLDLTNITTATVSNNTSTANLGGSLILIDGGNNGVTVTGNHVSGNAGSAVVILNRGAGPNQNIDIERNVFTSNAHDGVQIVNDPSLPSLTGAVPTVHFNTIAGNTRDGINNATLVVIDATKNWWGTPTGPANSANVGGTGNAVTANVTFTPWCGNDTCTLFYGIPTKLVFTTQPVGGAAGVALATQPIVTAQDAGGDLGINFTGPVALALGTNPTAATLGGTTTVNAAAGVATYSGLSVSTQGTGYTLVATSGGLTAGTSAPFTVGPPIPTVSGLDITTGTAAGGTTVVLIGTNFVAGDVVTFGGVTATITHVYSSTRLEVTTPAHNAGSVDVRVVNANSQGNTLPNGYTYITAQAVPGAPPGTRPGPVIGQGGPPPVPIPVGRPSGPPPPHP